MQDAYLHIGLPKTGSTYLQHWLSLNRAALREAGLCVPEKPGFGHRIREEFETYFAQGMPLPSDAIDIEAAFDVRPGDAALISSEGFSKRRPDEVKRYFDLKQVKILKVVVVLRRQDHFEASIYNQRVKVSRLADPYQVGAFGLNYLQLWQSWADSFGADNIVVLDYDHCRNGRKIEDVFLQRLGFKPLADPVLPDGTIATNPSPDAALLEIMRLNNLRGHASMVSPLKQHAIGRMTPAPRFGLDPKQCAAVEDLFLDSNRKLADIIGAAGLETLVTPGWRSSGADFTGKDVTEQLVSLIAILAQASAMVRFSALDRDMALPGGRQGLKPSDYRPRQRADEIAALCDADGAALRLLFERAAGSGVFEPNIARKDATPSVRTGPTITHSTFNELIDVAAYATHLLSAKQEMRRRRQAAGRQTVYTTLMRAMPEPIRKSWLLRPDLLLKKAYIRTRSM